MRRAIKRPIEHSLICQTYADSHAATTCSDNGILYTMRRKNDM